MKLPPSPTFFSIFLPTCFPERYWIWSWKNIDSFCILYLIPSQSTHTNFPLPVHDWKRCNSAPNMLRWNYHCCVKPWRVHYGKVGLHFGGKQISFSLQAMEFVHFGCLWSGSELITVGPAWCRGRASWSHPTSGCWLVCLDLVMGSCRVCSSCVPWLIAVQHRTNGKAERWV